MFSITKQFVSKLKSKVMFPFAWSTDSDKELTSMSADSAESSSTPLLAITPAVGRKRPHDRGDWTPNLVHPNSANYRAVVVSHGRSMKRKRIKGPADKEPDLDLSPDTKRVSEDSQEASFLLNGIPQDVLQSNICSYLTEAADYHALELTCKKLRKVSSMPKFLSIVNLTGDAETGKGSILYGIDSPAVALKNILKFAEVGNKQAMYMTGMIAAYCHGDKVGVNILRKNADMGCLRSAYTLGLILRDSEKKLSEKYLSHAIDCSYLPACQELLSSQDVKAKFGDLDYHSLKQFFDPIALNKLLGRTYLQSPLVRGVSTSHCWNPCCGRWALKATQNNSRGPQLQYPSKYLPPLSKDLEKKLLDLVGEDYKDYENKEVLSTQVAIPRTPRTPCERSFRVSRMKMCSSCRRAKYCSKLCQVYDWRSGQHKMECQYL